MGVAVHARCGAGRWPCATTLCGLVLWGLFGRVTAYADATTTFGVDASIVPGCAVTQSAADGATWGEIDFGSHLGLQDKSVDAQFVQASQLELQCTAGLSLQMRIGPGQHYADGQRAMQRVGGDAEVVYTVYRDAAHADPIDADTPVALTAPDDATPLTLPIYARAEITSGTPSGRYTDQLTVELSW